jgi:hypothetical protein
VEWPHRRGRIAGQGTANWTSAAESHAAAAVIVRVPQGIRRRISAGYDQTRASLEAAPRTVSQG